MGQKKQMRAVHVELFVETDMNDLEMQDVAKKASLSLSQGCKGRFLIAISVLRPTNAEKLWNAASQIRGNDAKCG